MLVQRRREDSRAALRLMRKLLKQQGFAPRLLVTDKLRSYASAFRRLRLTCQRQHLALQLRLAIRQRAKWIASSCRDLGEALIA